MDQKKAKMRQFWKKWRVVQGSTEFKKNNLDPLKRFKTVLLPQNILFRWIFCFFKLKIFKKSLKILVIFWLKMGFFRKKSKKCKNPYFGLFFTFFTKNEKSPKNPFLPKIFIFLNFFFYKFKYFIWPISTIFHLKPMLGSIYGV